MKGRYILEVRALPTGTSEADYLITKELFESFDNEDIKAANVECKVQIDKSEQLIYLSLLFEGVITVECDRCLDNLDIKISHNDSLYLKFSNGEEQTDENVIAINEKENVFDLSQLLYESVLVNKPLRCVHGEVGEGECNKAMIEMLGRQEQMNEEMEEIDPRWAALKKIK
ncbi:MAG: DUF177 domain-containing protein [Bacteroidales bacterium]|nr:DUF177 domain-containing protein [Bacteroidales bacterium]